MATGHFSGKLFPNGPPSDHAGSNDTGLMSVSGPGAEPIKVQTDRQIDIFDHYNIGFAQNFEILLLIILINTVSSVSFETKKLLNKLFITIRYNKQIWIRIKIKV